MRIISKLFLAAALLTTSAANALAVPAYPGTIKALQANGTEITIRLIGDEYSHMTVTADGYPLLFNASTRNYEYAELHNGTFTASGITATEPATRDKAATTFLATIDKDAVMAQWATQHDAAMKQWNQEMTAKRATSTQAQPQRIVRISDVPTTGKHDVLVILVQFADSKFTDNNMMDNPVNYYDRFFHQEGFSDNGARGSVYDFYTYGSNYMYDPQFKVYGPVTVSQNAEYYAGRNGSANTYKLIQEAVPLVNEQYDVDFSTFDTDGDGVVDNVYCIYAGKGQADGGGTSTIWPHSYNLDNSSADRSFLVDGVKIDRYTVSQEVNGVSNVPVGIGTFVHEFGHVLGFADHYNNSSSWGGLVNNVGNWDVMASGSYNGDQNCPPTFSAFERYSLGWTQPTVLNAKTDTLINLLPYESSSQSYRVNISADDTEYYLIENRQQTGWDEYLPGHGMLVWHILEDQAVWDSNKPNYDQNMQYVDIVEAAQVYTTSGTASDAFPGTANVTEYNFTSWSNRNIFGFAWLRECDDQLCQFILTNTAYRLPQPSLTVDDVMGTSATLSWGTSELATSYNVYVRHNGELIDSIASEDKGSFSVSGLEPETEYTAQVVARLASLSSDTVNVAFTTLPRQIEEQTPVALLPTDITSDGFTAAWQPVPDATDYELNIYRRTLDGDGTVSTGFDDFSTSANNLPEGWSVTEGQGRSTVNYGEASPALRLRDDNANLVCSVPGWKVQSVSFWYHASKAGIILDVDKHVDGQWTNVWSHTAENTNDLTENVEVDGADSIRFVVRRTEDTSGGFMLVDDVTLHYLYDQFELLNSYKVGPAGSDSFQVLSGNGVCGYTLSGLDMSQDYAYNVKGIWGDRISLQSNMINVTEGQITDGIQIINNASLNDSNIIYDLQGRRIATVTADGKVSTKLPQGIYIVNGKKVVLK